LRAQGVIRAMQVWEAVTLQALFGICLNRAARKQQFLPRIFRAFFFECRAC
jgi:hypothetical protein